MLGCQCSRLGWALVGAGPKLPLQNIKLHGMCHLESMVVIKHFQTTVKDNFTSLLVLNKKIKVCLGWDESSPMDHVVSCKKLRCESLHTFKGMIRYCMKDNGEQHFEIVHHNVSAEDMSDGKTKYVKIDKVGLKQSSESLS